ncbi:MAG: hypothetical protein U0L11_07625, partial [Acutalibacteraceae bacterium]|nr:hypothetical protein [Acutalibacteraceae bacterium]
LRGMKNLSIFPHFSSSLTDLLTGDFSADEIKYKQRIIEEICSEVAEYLRKNGLSACKNDFLEPHAYEIQNKIKNPEIRLLHIMEGGAP